MKFNLSEKLKLKKKKNYFTFPTKICSWVEGYNSINNKYREKGNKLIIASKGQNTINNVLLY